MKESRIFGGKCRQETGFRSGKESSVGEQRLPGKEKKKKKKTLRVTRSKARGGKDCFERDQVIVEGREEGGEDKVDLFRQNSSGR